MLLPLVVREQLMMSSIRPGVLLFYLQLIRKWVTWRHVPGSWLFIVLHDVVDSQECDSQLLRMPSARKCKQELPHSRGLPVWPSGYHGIGDTHQLCSMPSEKLKNGGIWHSSCEAPEIIDKEEGTLTCELNIQMYSVRVYFLSKNAFSDDHILRNRRLYVWPRRSTLWSIAFQAACYLYLALEVNTEWQDCCSRSLATNLLIAITQSEFLEEFVAAQRLYM